MRNFGIIVALCLLMSECPAQQKAGSLEATFLKDLELLNTTRSTITNDSLIVVKYYRPSRYNDQYQFSVYRVEEHYAGRESTENLKKRLIMAGSHVLLTVNPGYDDTDIKALFSESVIGVPRRIPNSDTYIVPVKQSGADPVDVLKSYPVNNASGKRQYDRMVKYIEHDYIVFADVIPNDVNFNLLWGLHNVGAAGGTLDADIDAAEAWDKTTGNANLVVGVIDTGIDYLHPDLAANIWTNASEVAGVANVDDDSNGYVDDIYGWNFYSGNKNPKDDNMHGSHVAGTIGAVGNNSTGVTGVAWKVKMISLKFLGAFGSGAVSGAIGAVKYASNVSNVIATNNSWGGGGYTQALKDAIDEAGLRNILFIAAAGNNSNDNDANPTYPASYPSSNIISVAATDRNDQLASFSNYGHKSVHIGAPGVDIYSTVINNNYGSLQGTSMAAPHVTGSCVLLKSLYPAMNSQQIKDKILMRGDRKASLAFKTTTGARLNVNSAMIVVPPQDMMVGAIISFYGDPAYLPENWVICNGQRINDLGSPTFHGKNVPDLSGRFIRGADQRYPYNSIGGVDEVKDHSHYMSDESPVWHPINSGNGRSTGYAPANRAGGFDDNYVNLAKLKTDSNPYESHGHMNGIAHVSGLTYGAGAHNNMPAFYALYYIIKIK